MALAITSNRFFCDRYTLFSKTNAQRIVTHEVDLALRVFLETVASTLRKFCDGFQT